MTTALDTKKVQCCPDFHPERWDEKTISWIDKPFIKTSVPTLFHIPFKKTLGKKISKLIKVAEDSALMPKDESTILLLFHDPHPFRSDVYLSVLGEASSAKNTTLSGLFLTKVFDGPYRDVPKFMKQMNTYLDTKQKRAKDYYVHYAYCPKCAQEKGHNYMILFAQVVDDVQAA